jgi:hypothetical protein
LTGRFQINAAAIAVQADNSAKKLLLLNLAVSYRMGVTLGVKLGSP